MRCLQKAIAEPSSSTKGGNNNEPIDPDQMFANYVASEMHCLSLRSKSRFKHDVTNLLFKYQEQEAEKSAPSYLSPPGEVRSNAFVNRFPDQERETATNQHYSNAGMEKSNCGKWYHNMSSYMQG